MKSSLFCDLDHFDKLKINIFLLGTVNRYAEVLNCYCTSEKAITKGPVTVNKVHITIAREQKKHMSVEIVVKIVNLSCKWKSESSFSVLKKFLERLNCDRIGRLFRHMKL